MQNQKAMELDRITVTGDGLSERMDHLSGLLLRIKSFLLMIVSKTVSFLSRENEQSETAESVIAAESDTAEEAAGKKKILVSACLYGGTPVRYDGQDIALENRIFQKWKKEGRLIPVCPEVEGGLPVPRPPAERSGRKVITADGQDVTAAYHRGSVLALWLARRNDVAFAIFKENSPSCGSTYIYNGKFNGTRVHGEGTAVEFLRNAGISVFNEKEIMEADAFLRAVEEKGWSTDHVDEIRIRSGITRVV